MPSPSLRHHRNRWHFDRENLAPARSPQGPDAYIKTHQDKLNLGNAGLGAASHLCGLLFTSAIGTNITTIPYHRTGPALAALMGGQIDIMCDQTTNTPRRSRLAA